MFNTVPPLFLGKNENTLVGSGGELMTSSVSHRDSSVVLSNGKSDGASLSSSSDGMSSNGLIYKTGHCFIHIMQYKYHII